MSIIRLEPAGCQRCHSTRRGGCTLVADFEHRLSFKEISWELGAKQHNKVRYRTCGCINTHTHKQITHTHTLHMHRTWAILHLGLFWHRCQYRKKLRYSPKILKSVLAAKHSPARPSLYPPNLIPHHLFIRNWNWTLILPSSAPAPVCNIFFFFAAQRAEIKKQQATFVTSSTCITSTLL